jgi:hypothetical protein
VPNDVLEEGGEWLEHLPEFKACLSDKSLYKHLLGPLNFADGADGLVEGLSPSQLDLALAATDDTGFDAHLAEALGEAEKQRRMTSKASFRRAREGERKLACFFPSRVAHLN